MYMVEKPIKAPSVYDQVIYAKKADVHESPYYKNAWVGENILKAGTLIISEPTDEKQENENFKLLCKIVKDLAIEVVELRHDLDVLKAKLED